MRITFRATVLVGLLALSSVFIQPVDAAGPTTKIVIEPATATVTADQTQTFKVMAVAADNTSTDVTSQSTISVNDPLGKVDGAIYTPGKAGSWTVQAAFQSFTVTGSTTVTPGAPKEIVINPNTEPEQVYLGINTVFSATVYDAKNNVVPNQTVVWSVIGENGTIDAQGVFVPATIGTGKIQAALGSIIGQVSLVVNAAIVTDTNTANTNTVRNTNTAKNINTANTNTTTNTSTNTAITSTENQAQTTSCTTMKPWVWIILLVVFLAGVAMLFALVPVTAIWPVVAAVLGAAILSYVQRKYGCDGQVWWAWVMMLSTLALAGAALMMRPKNTPTV